MHYAWNDLNKHQNAINSCDGMILLKMINNMLNISKNDQFSMLLLLVNKYDMANATSCQASSHHCGLSMYLLNTDLSHHVHSCTNSLIMYILNTHTQINLLYTHRPLSTCTSLSFKHFSTHSTNLFNLVIYLNIIFSCWLPVCYF